MKSLEISTHIELQSRVIEGIWSNPLREFEVGIVFLFASVLLGCV